MEKTEADEYWFAEGIRFACRRCGNCCRGEPGYVWVTPAEISRMAEHLDVPRDKFVRKCVRREGTRLSLRERPNGDCVLWQGECKVYESRPSQCRTFPFWTYAMRSQAMFVEVCRGCPGVGEGRLYTCEDILAIAAALRDT